MKKLILPFFFLCSTISIAQNTINKNTESISTDTQYHSDDTFGYKVAVPKWLDVKETGTEYIWGGTLPAINGIENALILKIYNKDKFNFQDFKKYVVTDLKLGQTPGWSDGSHIFTMKKELEKYKNFDSRYKIYLMRDGQLYHCQFVLIETPKAYIWIDFTATPETYEKNEKKLLEFLDGFQILK
jgi:hypothetical protein